MRAVTDLAFRYEWEPAPGVRSAELSATWARLELWVGDECVTLVEDKASQSTRRSIYVSLYPLAEWIAGNWWLLQADARSTLQPASPVAAGLDAARSKQFQRHNVRAAGDGFAWPDLLVIPEGQVTRLAWRHDRTSPVRKPVKFLGQGDALVQSESVLSSFASLVESVLTRLSEQGVAPTALATEWEQLKQTDDEEAEFCLAAARLGLDPYAEAEPFEADILRAAEQLRGPLFEDFLNAVNPRHIGAALDWIAQSRMIVETDPRPSNTTVEEVRRNVRQATSQPAARPWELGWRQADQVRTALGVREDSAFGLDDLVQERTRITDERGLQAFGGATGGRMPVVVLGRKQSDALSRFTLARGLWHVLYRDDPDFLVTAAYTDRQKIERAFAAELLAPAHGIARRLGDSSAAIAPEDLEPIAEHFRVSPMVIQHQVENQLGAYVLG